MPNKHSALKALRQERQRRLRNAAVRGELRTLTKRLLALLKAQQLDEARAMIRQLGSRYDRAAAKGVVHPNTASRLKSRLTRRLRQPTTKRS